MTRIGLTWISASLLDDLLKDLLRFLLANLSFTEARGVTFLLPFRVLPVKVGDDLAQYLLYGVRLFSISTVLAGVVQFHEQVLERRVLQLQHQPFKRRWPAARHLHA